MYIATIAASSRIMPLDCACCRRWFSPVKSSRTSPGRSAAAAICYADLWGVWNYLKNQFRAGLLFSSQSNRREFQFDPAIPVQSQGGVAGWSIPIRIQLGGYNSP